MAYYHFVIMVGGGLEAIWLLALHNRGVIKWEPLWVIAISWLAYTVDYAVPDSEWIRVYLANGEYVDWTRCAGWMCTCPVLILFLVSMTTFGGREASVRVVPLLVANQVMFLAGVTSAVCANHTRWWFYGLGCTAGSYVLTASVVCFHSLYSFFDDPSARNIVIILGFCFFVGWLVFPVVWTFGHSGLDMVGPLVTNTVYLIGDILAKNLFVAGSVVLKTRHLTEQPRPWRYLLPWDDTATRWGRLAEALNNNSTAPQSENSGSAAAAHNYADRKAAARKLIENQPVVLRDITRQDIRAPASQPDLVRLPAADILVDSCLYEVARRLLGIRSFRASRVTAAQASTWIATTEYLSARLQATTEDVANIPGHEARKPDMSVPAAEAMRAVLAEVTADQQNMRWDILNAQFNLDLPEADDAGVSKSHSYEARKEAAGRLIMNHGKVLHDITRADGPPPTQPSLVRLPRKEHQVDACLYEVCRRLLGAPADPLDRLLTTKSATQAAVWIATAQYLTARIHSAHEEVKNTPGFESRKPDMSPSAADAMKAVLAEIISQQQSLRWDRFNDKRALSQVATGAAGQHDYGARKEAAHKLIVNHFKVLHDITRADGSPVSQQGLVRVTGVDTELLVAGALEEVSRRLLGGKHYQQMKPTYCHQAATWIATAEFLIARIHSLPEECENTPGFEHRRPDMSKEAGAAMKAVLAELALEMQNIRWGILKEHLAAGSTSDVRNEAARKLISNHGKVLHDITRADGPPPTQPNLVRLPRKEHQVDACMYEIARRLLGARLDPRDRLLTTKSAAQAATWIATAQYLTARIHSSPDEVTHTRGFEDRKPDMSLGAAAAMKTVLAEVTTEQQSLRWDLFNDEVTNQGGAFGAAGQHDYGARKEAAHKLIVNHVKVVHDITRADGSPPTQQGLVRLPGAEDLVEGVLEEVSHRLLGNQPYQYVRPTSAAQAATWIATAEFLSARVHSSPEEVENTPGFESRKPDMSFAAGAAVKAVLAELTVECMMLRWSRFKEHLASGSASEARKEAAQKLISNHLKVLHDITRADGPAPTQPNLVRLPQKEHQVDACLYEVCRRLIGARPDPQDRLVTTKSAAQAATWIATAQYLTARVHSSPLEVKNTPGHQHRQPDMSPGAADAMKAVLAEILVEQQSLRWDRFNDKLSLSQVAFGAAGQHDYSARKEAAHKFITNHVKVLHDITRADGSPPTQQGLVRLPGYEYLVEGMLEEMSRRLLGGLPYQHVIPANCHQAATWIATAEFLSARVHSSPDEVENTPGFENRKPDMSEEAGAAVKAVLAELALEMQNIRWNSLKEHINGVGSPDELNTFSAAVYHDYDARKEAAQKFINNRIKVIHDITRADGPPPTQPDLVRLPRKEHQVDACLYEVCRRLLGVRPDPRDRLLTTKNAAQAATWIATTQYLTARIHSSPDEVTHTRGFESRKPDMSSAAAAAVKAVLAEVAADPADQQGREGNSMATGGRAKPIAPSQFPMTPRTYDFIQPKYQSPAVAQIAASNHSHSSGTVTPTGPSEFSRSIDVDSIDGDINPYPMSAYSSGDSFIRRDRRPSMGNIALDDIGSDVPVGQGPSWDAAVRKLAQARSQAAAAMQRLTQAREEASEYAPSAGLVRFV